MAKDDMEYAKGELLVKFKVPDYLQILPKEFAESMGYEYIGDWELADEICVFRVPENKENEAIKKIISRKEYVDWAEQRCITYEKRVLGLETAIGELEELRDNAELPKKEYNKKIEEIIGYLEKQKE